MTSTVKLRRPGDHCYTTVVSSSSVQPQFSVALTEADIAGLNLKPLPYTCRGCGAHVKSESNWCDYCGRPR